MTFDDMSEFHVPIRFRSPHDLWSEIGEHHTTLLQAQYGFTAAAQAAFSPEGEIASHCAVPSVLHWEIELSSCLVVPNIILDIFGEAMEKDSDLDVLLRLENELPVRLMRFTPQSDWLPEDSYLEEETDTGDLGYPNSEIKRSLVAAAEDRPLYIRNSPLLVEKTGGYSTSKFLESTMNKWWKNQAVTGMERDYFKYIDPDGNAVWIFKDSSGHWYQHGIFG